MTPRERLAARQAELVRGLWSGEPLDGFDPASLRSAGESLRRKRCRAASAAWPRLAAALEGRLAPLFDQYAREEPLPEGGPLADGFLFACRLRDRSDLPEAGLWELARAELRWRVDHRGRLHRRKLAFLRFHPRPEKLAVGLRVGPWERWMVISGGTAGQERRPAST